MVRHLCRLLLVGIVSLIVAPVASAQEAMADNPYYKFWAGFKPGATAVQLEKTKMSGMDGRAVPNGTDERRIVYKLVEVNKDRAGVEMVVTEQDLLGFVEAAPTRYIYPASLKKSHLDRILPEASRTVGEEILKFDGKDLKCRTVAGTAKTSDEDQIEFKLWLSDDVPGKVVKQVRTARQKGKTVAETTTTLQSYKKPG